MLAPVAPGPGRRSDSRQSNAAARRTVLLMDTTDAVPTTRRGPRPDGSAPEPTCYAVVPSPVGDLTLSGTATAITGCWFEGHAKPTDLGEHLVRDDARFADAAEQLAAYFDGRLRRFDLELAPDGTPFQLRVWEQLRAIPYGETRSYGQLADALGAPGASRAVGMANGRNPLSIIVPCHRVIGADGSLTGFAGGTARKRLLLDLETGVDRLV